MASSVTLQALGLNTSQNQLIAPEGSLVVASNVIIRRSGVIESRRGIKLYGNTMGTNATRASQIIGYKNRLIRHFTTSLQYDDGSGTFSSFSGSYSPASSSLRIKSIESNGNLYFTSSDGIKKISASSASDLSSITPTQAGGIKAVDLTGYLNTNTTNTAWFVPDSVVAYRVLWGIKDLNSNLILGTPSERFVIYNPEQEVIVRDFLKILNAIDDVGYAGSSLITDTNYTSTLKVTLNDTATTINSNVIALASKLDNDITLANVGGTGGSFDMTAATYTIASNIVTITFATDPSAYFAAGDQIRINGIDSTIDNDDNNTTSNPAYYTLSSVNSGPKTIVFPYTHANAGPTAIASGTINSYKFRALTAPTVSANPATHQELSDIYNYLNSIITLLQGEPTTVISSSSQTNFITPLELSIGYTVNLNITIPAEITTSYFYQIYRTSVLTATGGDIITDLIPNDEMKLMYEATPTAAEISAGNIIIEDITSDAFAGANLYTNPSSGEGIAQANDIPPFALDINRFKEYTFFANTRTRYRLQLQLLSVADMIAQYTLGNTPTVTITNGTTTNTYTFVTGVQEVTNITCVADVANSLNGKYFSINSANDQEQFYVWFDTNGSGVDPAIANKTGIKVYLSTGDVANTVALKITNTLNSYVDQFSVTNSTNTITITNINYGSSTDATMNTSGFTLGSITQGRGEGSTQVLLSDLTSPAQAVDETIRSFVRVLNKNDSESVYAYNISSQEDLPGKIYLESRSLSTTPFYVMADSVSTGSEFNPDISPTLIISTIGTGATPTITTSTSHGLSTGAYVIISGSNSTPSIDGKYQITSTGASTFTIIKTVTVGGTYGGVAAVADVNIAENEEQPNRIYYSKYHQPEAVPLLNYFDVGAKDKIIYRIYPLRDSLFVFKEDGIFRVSGEIAPFTVSLFDGTSKLSAPDSLGDTNNQIIGWVNGGISSITESGVSSISRSIDIDLIKVTALTNFTTATFGIGYNNDSSYIVFIPSTSSDTRATMAYRYSTITNSWTTFTHGATCGIVNFTDDKMYLGAEDTNSLEVERKTFSRFDYADREYTKIIDASTYIGSVISFSNISDFEIGDVISQSQYVTTYKYNMLLKKLDNDTSLSGTDYYSSLQASNGNHMSTKLDSLIAKIRDDAGRQSIIGHTADATYTALIPTPSTFVGQKNTWNSLMTIMNSDLGISYSDFASITTTTDFETIITAVDKNQKKITIKDSEQFIQGDITLYKAIASDITWTAQSMGDPLSLKQIWQGTLMLEARAFTDATLSFATDLLPKFESVSFTGDSNGAFGVSNTFGNNFFGGTSNSAPLRTTIPLNKQRCRYMVVKYSHTTAFEQYAVLGITLTGNLTSVKGYR